MKKSLVVVLLILVAAASSAATIGVLKYMEKAGSGGDIIIVTDKRCAECPTDRIDAAMKRQFPETKVVTLDYGDRAGKKIYDSEKLTLLPAVLLPKGLAKTEGFTKLERFAELGKNYYFLKTGGSFDPKAEICDNEKDDTGNGLVDCNDPTCKSDWRCMEKRDVPNVDVFVMSHCPFGTQIEKGILPVWELFGDKINLAIRFVDYAMHGKKEVDEQLKQYCVQQQGKETFQKYLTCFLKEGKEGDACNKAAGVDDGKLTTCMKEADAKFNISKDFDNKEKWMGRFPPFGIDAALAKKHNVRGSPTLVINDVVVQSGRNPKAIQEAICRAFKQKPAECDKPLSAENPSPGFGSGKEPGSKAAENTKCGG